MYHIFLIHFFFLVDGHLGCSQVLAITNNAAMNIVEHLSLWYDQNPLGIYTTAILLGLEVDCFLIF